MEENNGFKAFDTLFNKFIDYDEIRIGIDGTIFLLEGGYIPGEDEEKYIETWDDVPKDRIIITNDPDKIKELEALIAEKERGSIMYYKRVNADGSDIPNESFHPISE